MSNTYTVYKHTFPNNKIYIGITKRQPETRYGKGGSQYKNNQEMWDDIQKYGWENILHEILFENVPEEKVSVLEQELIEKYCSNNPLHGYNRNKGGLSGISTYYNESEIIDLFKLGMSEYEISNKIGCCSRTVSEILHKNGITSDEIAINSNRIKREKTSFIETKKDQVLDLFYNQHKTISEIAKIIGVERQCIDKLFTRLEIPHELIFQNSFAIHEEEKNNIKEMVLNGITLKEIAKKYGCASSSVKHFIEYYLPEFSTLIEKNANLVRAKSFNKTIEQYSLDNKYIQTFKSIKDAAKAIGKNPENCGHISSVCKGKRKSAYGFKWKYSDIDANIID